MVNQVVDLAKTLALFNGSSAASSAAKSAKALEAQAAEQTAQLAGIRGELQALHMNEAKRAAESSLRTLVFEQETKPLNMRANLTTAPAAVLVASRVIEWAFQKTSISPASFEQFADKDRTRQTLKILRENVEQAEQAVTPEEKRQVTAALGGYERLALIEEFEQQVNARTAFLAANAAYTRAASAANAHNSQMTAIAIVVAFVTCGLGLFLLATRQNMSRLNQQYQEIRRMKQLFSDSRLAQLEQVLGKGVNLQTAARMRDEIEDQIRGVLIVDRNGEPITPPLMV